MKKGGPKQPSDHVAVRLKPEEIERIEALRERLSTPWHPATRSDALRAVILKGLERMEKEEGPGADEEELEEAPPSPPGRGS